jgi:hypothetical protein
MEEWEDNQYILRRREMSPLDRGLDVLLASKWQPEQPAGH